MFTFKQLEAVYWIADLGGFAAAARKLNTTQSAVSKRIQELESSLGEVLFDREKRQARLSEKGEQVLVLARRLLEHRDAAVEQLSKPEVVARRVRIGVTELTAITWLPRLVRLIRQTYPRVVIEPDVDSSLSLRDKLLADEMDLIIAPDVVADARFASHRVGTARLAWMCKPGLLPTSRAVSLQELASTTILTQGDRSGTTAMFKPWLQSPEFLQANTISSNNTLVLIGLTVAGIGVSYLPLACLKPLIERRALAVVKTSPSLPEINYVALFRSGRKSTLISSLVSLAQQVCDFSSLFQTDALDAKASEDLGRALFSKIGTSSARTARAPARPKMKKT
ncbi:LysR family transcriptional regulator [Variovorax sp. PBL-E5]|uniref:LysR family transcriptional regulator n=1 Tax=Variovorax sp. PBL-E5 TaxID=434014 RepID=UPI0013175EC7|nr:LysR family transcriptional regulator [Variovorax sp. PBL-E5]VTU30145.1 HTH-type transcriptional regulator GltR [Variovorax sp. PBL-E5]